MAGPVPPARDGRPALSQGSGRALGCLQVLTPHKTDLVLASLGSSLSAQMPSTRALIDNPHLEMQSIICSLPSINHSQNIKALQAVLGAPGAALRRSHCGAEGPGQQPRRYSQSAAQSGGASPGPVTAANTA